MGRRSCGETTATGKLTPRLWVPSTDCRRGLPQSAARSSIRSIPGRSSEGSAVNLQHQLIGELERMRLLPPEPSFVSGANVWQSDARRTNQFSPSTSPLTCTPGAKLVDSKPNETAAICDPFPRYSVTGGHKYAIECLEYGPGYPGNVKRVSSIAFTPGPPGIPWLPASIWRRPALAKPTLINSRDGTIVIPPEAHYQRLSSGYGNTNYYFDDGLSPYLDGQAAKLSVIENGIPAANVIYAGPIEAHITAATNVAAYVTTGPTRAPGQGLRDNGDVIFTGIVDGLSSKRGVI